VNFDVAGPFDITRHGPKRLIAKQSIKDLRENLEKWAEGLSEACGRVLTEDRQENRDFCRRAARYDVGSIGRPAAVVYSKS